MDRSLPTLWQFNAVDVEANLSLAALVAQSDWFVDSIVGDAFARFARYTAGRYASFQVGLARDDATLARLAMASLFHQAQRECRHRRLRYESERAFDPRSGRQRVLRPAQIVQGKNATCLDWALFGAALAAQVKLLPIAIVLLLEPGAHAIAAIYLKQPRSDRKPWLSAIELLAEIEHQRILAFDCTKLALDPSRVSFTAACATARQQIARAAAAERGVAAAPRSVGVDVWRAWDLGYHPFAASEVSTLRRQLAPIDFSALVTRLTQDFVGRERLRETVSAWLDLADDPVFWIVGEPGVGKSTLAAYLSQLHAARLAGCHFCAHDDEQRASPRAMVASLAFQLSATLPGYHAWLTRQDLSRALEQPPMTLFAHFLVNGVQEAYPFAGAAWLIVVDALDEATRDGHNPLAQFLGGLAARRALPPSLKILLTSRPAADLARALVGIRPHLLAASSPDQHADIAQYLALKLGHRLAHPAVHAIVEQSQGSFLYARCVVDEAQRNRAGAGLPLGVVAFYARTLARQFTDAQPHYRSHARPLLELLAAAPAPLPRVLAQEALSLEPAALQRLVDQLSALLQSDDRGLRFQHAQAREWLLDGDAAGPYVIDVATGRRALADLCWQRLGHVTAIEAQYCRAYLPGLLCDERQWGRLARLLLRTDLAQIDWWIDTGRVAQGISILERLVGALGSEHALLAAGFATQIARLHLLGEASEAARPWLDHALHATSWTHGRRVRAIALHEMGSLELYAGHHDQARALYRRALRVALWGLPPFHDEAAGNLVALANLAVGRAALRHGRAALRHAERAGDVRHQVAAGRVVAATYKWLGAFEAAEGHIRAALLLAAQRGLRHEGARALAERASIAYWSEAIGSGSATAHGFYEDALHEAEQVADFYGAMRTRIGLGLCALRRGASGAAESLFATLRGRLPERTDPELRIQLELGLAAVRLQQGALTEAIERYSRVIVQCEPWRDWLAVARARAMVGLGVACWRTADPVAAERWWRDARRVAAPLPGLARLIDTSIARCRSDNSQVPA